jgi:colicin import membrane protein
MARKTTASARAAAPAKAAKSTARPAAKAKAKKAPAVQRAEMKVALPKAVRQAEAPRVAEAPKAKAKLASVEEALQVLLAKGEAASDGGAALRADALADAQAARALAEKLSGHKLELARRGLLPLLTEAAVHLAGEIESHLQSLGAATRAARERSPEEVEVLSEAAALAHAVREAVARVSRGVEGREATHAFGLGEAFNARQPAHVLRALRRIAAAAVAHPQTAADAGLLPEDLENAAGLAEEIARIPGADARDDASEKLHRSHAALRAWFDLVGAKVSLGMSADREEQSRLLALIPRGHERRHHLRRLE